MVEGGPIPSKETLMKIWSKFLAVAVAALFGAAPASAALAPVAMAPDGAVPQTQQMDQDEAQFSDEELKTFVVAVIEVQRINDDYMNKLGAVSTPEEQDRVLQTAADQMTQVVEKNGMTVDRFTEILNHAQMNPQLASRVRKHMNEVH
jgi:hypothetical protein